MKQRASDYGHCQPLHLHHDVEGTSILSGRFSALQHFLRGLGHQCGQERQALTMKRRLCQSSSPSPSLPVTGQQPVTNEWLEQVRYPMLLGVIVIIILQDMLDVIGVIEKVAGQRTAGVEVQGLDC